MENGDIRKEVLGFKIKRTIEKKKEGNSEKKRVRFDFSIDECEGIEDGEDGVDLYTNIIDTLNATLGNFFAKGLKREALVMEGFWEKVVKAIHQFASDSLEDDGKEKLPPLKFKLATTPSEMRPDRSVVIEMYEEKGMTVEFNRISEPAEMCMMASTGLCAALLHSYPNLVDNGVLNEESFAECVDALKGTLVALGDRKGMHSSKVYSKEEVESIKKKILDEDKDKKPTLTLVK